MPKSIVIIAAVILLVAAYARAEDFDYEPAIYWWRGSYGDPFDTHDVIEIVTASRLGHSPFVYEYPYPTIVPIIGREHPNGSRTDSYNFRAVACALTMFAERGLDGRPILTATPSPRWWTYLLMAHNNTWKLRLSRGIRFTLTTRTDIPWVGFDQEDQGILFTPRLGFEWVGLSTGFETEDPPITNRLHVGLGHGYWWGFDGQDRATDWTFVVGVAFMLAK